MHSLSYVLGMPRSVSRHSRVHTILPVFSSGERSAQRCLCPSYPTALSLAKFGT